MAIIQRPTKQGGATTFQGKIAQGYTKILASEADADIDTIFAAWNGGADTVNLRDNAVTSAKIAPGAVGTRELADGGVATGDLADLAVTTAKLADLAVITAKLADLGVTTGKLALRATIPTQALASLPSAVTVTNTEQVLLTVTPTLSRGAFVLLLVDAELTGAIIDTAATTAMLRLYRGATFLAQRPVSMSGPAAMVNFFVPASAAFAVVDVGLAPGSTTYTVRHQRTAGTGAWTIASGGVVAVEFA